MKEFVVRVVAKGSHGKYGKETYRELIVEADSKKEAQQKALERMLSATYREFFPMLNDERFLEHPKLYSFGGMLRTMDSHWCSLSDEEILTQLDEIIGLDVLERVDFIVKSRKSLAIS